MTCMELQPEIAKFIDYQLSDEEASEFMEHIQMCEDCMNEVEFHFILIHGFRQLSDDDTKCFNDFNQQFQDFIEDYDHRIGNSSFQRFNKDIFFGILFLIFTLVLLYVVDIIEEVFF